jgi:hypothetical protein
MPGGTTLGVICLMIIVAMVFVLQSLGKMPPIQTFKEVASVMETVGGKIMLLAVLLVMFSLGALKFLYWSLSMVSGHSLAVDNPLLSSGVNWTTGVLVGGVLGAMLTLMNATTGPKS